MASKVTKFITISIGSSEIKLSELDSSKKNISVLWAETVPTPADSYDEGEIVDIEKISPFFAGKASAKFCEGVVCAFPK